MIGLELLPIDEAHYASWSSHKIGDDENKYMLEAIRAQKELE